VHVQLSKVTLAASDITTHDVACCKYILSHDKHATFILSITSEFSWSLLDDLVPYHVNMKV